MRMAPQSYFIIVCFIIIFACCPLCLVSSHSDDGLDKFIESKRYQVTKHRSSLKIVNVDDFGAKGDASDDSEVGGFSCSGWF